MNKMLKKCKELIPFKIAIAVLVVIILLLGTIKTFRNATLDFISAIYGSVIVNLTNKERSKVNLSELKVSPILEKAAQMKANDMAEKGYFAHNTPEGHSPWYWFEKAGYQYIYAGENLAVNFLNSEDVETAWQNSPTHWYNIISPKYTEIGVATSTGFYKGRSAIFVVQLFGTPVK